MQTNESYRHLLDIIALDLVVKRLNDETIEQEKRIQLLNSKKSDKENQLLDLKENHQSANKLMSQKEKELFETDTKIEKSNHALNEATTNQQVLNLEENLSKLKNQKLELEDSIFLLIEECEDTQKLIEESLEFISGVTSTITEISKDAEIIKNENSTKIHELESQIKGILEEVDNSLRNTFLSVRKILRFNEPIARINNLSCSKCRFTMSRSDADHIEIKDNFLICGGCGRLIIASRHF